jgi:GxxExxY protein
MIGKIELSGEIIRSAIEVHRLLGPGMLEKTYKLALSHELQCKGFRVETEVPITLCYKELIIPNAYFMDLVVEEEVVVELKSIEQLGPMHHAQLLTYLRHSGMSLGLLMNFHEPILKNGIRRVVN